MACELCGKQEDFCKALVEDIEMTVCSGCSKFGRVVKKLQSSKLSSSQIASKSQISLKPVKKELVEDFVEDYDQIIKHKREKMNLNQKDFAKLLNVDENWIHKIETKSLKPTLELGRKIEKILRVKLIETVQEGVVEPKKSSSVLTIGDLVKIKNQSN